MRIAFSSLALAACLLAGCRTAYYSAWEQLGKHKRDLLKDNVGKARDEQKEAAEEFKDALSRLKELYQFDGGNLEKTYKRLKSDYDDCASRASNVRERIAKVEQIASDLFSEWEKEAGEISNPRLQSDSRSKLRQTRSRFSELSAAMRRAEGSMEPVLSQFKDHVLYLKHNLNAQAIGALKGEALDIQRDIDQLISSMNASIAEADTFIKSLPED